MTPQSVSHWIRAYDNVQGRMLAEYRLPESWTLKRLQDLFGVSEDNPMFDCYPINDAVARVLEPTVGVPLVCDDREFFLETDAEQ